jgi:acetoacetate decarboxylase
MFMLNSNNEGYSPPFDAPLYGSSYSPDMLGREFTISYDDCDAVSVFFTIDNDVNPILPEGIQPSSEPAVGGVFLARYPHSDLGAYNEFISLVQVEDVNGNLAHYIPYIYVTNDAALAAGREVAGAPKKLASIDLNHSGDTVQGILERPENKQLATVTIKPDDRAEETVVNEIFPLGEPVPLLSIRHLPPVEGGDGLSQLVGWYTEYSVHRDNEDELKMWQGSGTVSYDSPSPIDPIHNLQPDDVILATYSRFDMELGVNEVQKEWTH